MRNLSIAGKITVFKTVSMSKIVRLTLVKLIPNSIILEFDKTKKHFIWENGNPKTKQATLCKDYENKNFLNTNNNYYQNGAVIYQYRLRIRLL